MDPEGRQTAFHIVNTAGERELADIFFSFGEERKARLIARKIVQARKVCPIRTTDELARIVTSAIPPGERARRKIHPATKVFMALRIAVNRELEILAPFIRTAAGLLTPGGRICIISFHSLEDRIVKRTFAELESACECPPGLPVCVCGKVAQLKVLTRKPIRPSQAEVEKNPMARSARLRVAEKLQN